MAKTEWGGGFHGRARIVLECQYKDIISAQNLLEAWGEFVVGKRKRADVQEFQKDLMDNILLLRSDLADGTYQHSPYEAFKISDPKPRDIHKAAVRDRLVHRAVYRILYPFFNRTFITDSYSCRLEKGTHRAMNIFRRFAYRASKNDTRTLGILKCDIRKFFASIDQGVLLTILRQRIPDERIFTLLGTVIESFHSTTPGKGLPLGNLTSQLLVNVYMNEFDQFVRHTLKAKFYVRYADDFVILSADREHLTELLRYIAVFLRERLKLELHPDKVSITTLASGIDFLGWVHFPDHRVLRTTTRKRMFRRIAETNRKPETIQSYLGLLSHGNTNKLRAKIRNP